MRKSMTIRLDHDVLEVAKVRAKTENRTLTNYIETLIRKDIAKRTPDSEPIIDHRDDAPLNVFIAEPITSRLITDAQEGDTPEDVARRQEYLDLVTGWGRDE